MEYHPPERARELGGLRLVLTVGVPAPWGEAAKALCHVRKIEYTPVAQLAGEPNDALYEWTGVRNAPVAVWQDEPPRVGWLDTLMLIERIGTGPSLLPTDSALRAECIGISNEICGEWGFGWSRRLMILGKMFDGMLDGERSALPAGAARMLADYRVQSDEVARAPERVADILRMLTARLASQRTAGSDYLVGDALSAADVYWAAFSNMVEPLPEADNPMPDQIRALYDDVFGAAAEAMDASLIEHRDRIYRQHLALPLDF